jgi:hypothetical protein
MFCESICKLACECLFKTAQEFAQRINPVSLGTLFFIFSVVGVIGG